MKLLAKKKRKIAILFTSGLGDTVWYVPLMKELKRKHFNITCIFLAKYDNDCLFDNTLVDKKVFLKSKFSLLFFALTRFKFFSNIYVNHLEKGKLINLTARICSRVLTKISRDPGTGDLPKRRRKVIESFSDAEHNLYLLYSETNAAINHISSFYFPHPKLNGRIDNRIHTNITKGYYVLQISAGNNLTPYKNWPVINWLALIEKLCMKYPDHGFVIIGDETETGYIKKFSTVNYRNCKILIGKTSVEDVFNLIAKSNGYIGLDSGFMHISVALQKKTLAIFGGSNEKLYGYESLDPENHRSIASTLGCRPCYGWKNINTTRVTDPLLCPDFACLHSIDPDFVFEQITTHFKM